VVSVQDDGVGFDPAALRGGRGLANVRQRAGTLGAQARWTSTASGTLFELELPLRPEASGAEGPLAAATSAG
jgi:two-component system, NarL family, sensor histidine kinase UhpB